MKDKQGDNNISGEKTYSKRLPKYMDENLYQTEHCKKMISNINKRIELN